MSSQNLQEHVESRLDRCAVCKVAFGNARSFRPAFDDERGNAVRMRYAQSDAACRRRLASRNGIEREQYPVRLEGIVWAHREEKAPAPADQFADRGLQRATG